jgi:hypothetical protein
MRDSESEKFEEIGLLGGRSRTRTLCPNAVEHFRITRLTDIDINWKRCKTAKVDRVVGRQYQYR